jgi:hypothetical protein
MYSPDIKTLARAIQRAVQETYTARSTSLDAVEAMNAAKVVQELYYAENDLSHEYGVGSGTW